MVANEHTLLLREKPESLLTWACVFLVCVNKEIPEN